jgi:CBS domain containing-hemolysin-like protein
LFVKTGKRIALVQDRWGGTAGVITRGDILELIVKPVEEDE